MCYTMERVKSDGYVPKLTPLINQECFWIILSGKKEI